MLDRDGDRIGTIEDIDADDRTGQPEWALVKDAPDIAADSEELRIEREPITDANRDQAMQGPVLSEAEHEVVLQEQRPVTHNEVVPKEHVRAGGPQAPQGADRAGRGPHGVAPLNARPR